MLCHCYVVYHVIVVLLVSVEVLLLVYSWSWGLMVAFNLQVQRGC
jgi:hypothetical protein